jgi:hypothetical protein
MILQSLIVSTTLIICLLTLLYKLFNNYDINYYKKLLDKKKYYINSYNFINYKIDLINYSQLLDLDIMDELNNIDKIYISNLLKIKYKLDQKNIINNEESDNEESDNKESDNEESDNKESDNEDSDNEIIDNEDSDNEVIKKEINNE